MGVGGIPVRVYADLFFLLNASVDAALLLGAGRLAGLRPRPLRLIASASVGGLYSLAALLVGLPWLFGWGGRMACAVAMLALAYRPLHWRRFVTVVLLFFAVSAFTAGVALGIADSLGSGGAAFGVPWWVVALACGALLAGASTLWERWSPGPSGWCCRLEIVFGEQRTSCRALVDSGNDLRVAGSGRPAIVVTAVALRDLLPAPALCLLTSGQGASAAFAELAATAGGKWSTRLRLFPFASLGNRSGMLCGFEPDGAWVDDGRSRRRVRAAVAVTPDRLSGDGSFDALVPARLLADAERDG